MKTLSGRVTKRLGYYVYLYIDPRDESIFYVGKGSGARCLTHLSDDSVGDKAKKIAAIRASKLAPRIDILVHGLPDESSALQVEAAVIDLIGRKLLTNKVRGWNSNAFGRMELNELVSIYDAKPITIKDPALLIRINKLFRFGMSPTDLYDATRGIWKIGSDREKVEFVFAVFQGVVREVYKVTQWFPAGSTFYSREEKLLDPKRWEFVGVLADETIRKKYLNRSVASYFKQGSSNPIKYANVKNK